MDVEFLYVDARPRTAVPTVFEATGKFPEEAESFTQVQIHVHQIALHRVYVAPWCEGWIAGIFAAFPDPVTEREVIVDMFTIKPDELDRSHKSGSAPRVREILNIFVVSRDRKRFGSRGTNDCGILLALCMRGETRTNRECANNANRGPHNRNYVLSNGKTVHEGRQEKQRPDPHGAVMQHAGR